MKFLGAQITYLLTERQTRTNLKSLFKFVLFLGVVIVVFSLVFHWIMEIEGQSHSWLTGVYWTLTVMSTLGFGDITFTSDLGRGFSVIVLLSGIILLLIVLPFAFIRFFYAPWLEAQIRMRAPRQVPPGTKGHVVVVSHTSLGKDLREKLEALDVPCYVIEPDPTRAADLHSDQIRVVTGEIDAVATYRALCVEDARAVVINLDDALNTNITLTVREAATEVPVIALAEEDDSVDLLELAGATHVIPLKRRLGEHLANRVRAGRGHAQIIGRFEDLVITEFPVDRTPMTGRTLRDLRLRQQLGINIVAVWERGRLLPPDPDLELTPSSVPVAVGTPERIRQLDDLLAESDIADSHPVLVIGGGKVGSAAAKALRAKGVAVHLVERDPAVTARLGEVADRVCVGDAADREVLEEAGLAETSSVVLTTNSDAINIYLAVYCRRLNPDLRIVSRITHQRNIEAIHRAGADFVLSYAHLGVETIISILRGRDLVLLGEGIDFFVLDLPSSLVGRSLADADLRRRTGLNVIGLDTTDGVVTNPPPELPLPKGSKLLALGTREQRRSFGEIFG